jgi:serine-type D-Ala-D-Ala carboxypeptidase/endopeptidase (penicillin-binding protein 4)
MPTVPQLRRLAVVSLALLCVFIIAAGVVVAHILPSRLARWDVARVAGRPAAPVSAPLRAAAGAAGRAGGAAGRAGGAAGRAEISRAGLAAALGPMLAAPSLGPHVGIRVTDLATGQVLYSRRAGAGFAPASTTKIATAVAALHVLGPAATFTTRVLAGRSAGRIILAGGGDPTLAAGTPPAADYPRPATLERLAAQTARALRARGRRRVSVGYDSSLYTGPGLAPGWPLSYVLTGNVTPISALEVDQGRLTPGGGPQDADDPDNSRPRTLTPASDAARAFVRFLVTDGIRVTGAPAPAPARADLPRRPATLAKVTSPPLAAIVTQMLLESNNVIAENLARHVALATGRPASFAGGAQAETAVLARLGVRGIHLVDGSGLSPRDRIAPASLVALVTLAASAREPGLRTAITGLPVAGFSGTLAPGGSVFAAAGPAALGVVRAKTGNLNTVAALAGIAYARDGQLLSFAVMADKLKAASLDAAGTQLARVATVLAGCGCRTGS